jgi:hypothetical protein
MALAMKFILILAIMASSGAQVARVAKISKPHPAEDSADEFNLLDSAVQEQGDKAKQNSNGGAPNLLSSLSGFGNSPGDAESAKDLFTFNPETQDIEAAADQTLPPSLSPTSLTYEPTKYPTGYPTGSPTSFPTPKATKDVRQVADWFLQPAKDSAGKSKPESSLSDIFARFDKKRKAEQATKSQALVAEAHKEALLQKQREEASIAKQKAGSGGAYAQYKSRKAKEEQLRSFRKTEALRKEANDLLHMSSSNPLLRSMSAKLKAEMADVLGTVSEGNKISSVNTQQPTFAPTTNKAVIKDWFFKPVKNPKLAVPTSKPTSYDASYHESAKEMMDKYLMADLRKEHIDVTKLSPALKQKMLGVISDLIKKQRSGNMPSANQLWARTEHVMAKDMLVKGGVTTGQSSKPAGQSSFPANAVKTPAMLLAEAKEKALKTEDRLMSDIFATDAGTKIQCDAKLENVPENHQHQCKLIALAKSHFTVPTEMKQTLHSYLKNPQMPQNAKALSKMKDILDSSLPGNRQVQELQKIVTSAAIYVAVGHGAASSPAAAKKMALQKEELKVLGKTVAPTSAPTVPSAPIKRVASWFEAESRDIERSLPILQTLLEADPSDRLADMDKFDHAAWFHSKVENALQSENHVKGQTDWFGHSKTQSKTPSWYLNEKKNGVPAWLKPTKVPTMPPGQAATLTPTFAPTTEDMYASFKERAAAAATPVPTPASWRDEGFLGELKAIEQQRKKAKSGKPTVPTPATKPYDGPPTQKPTHMVLPPQTKGNMVAWAKALLKRFPDQGLATRAPSTFPTAQPTKTTDRPTPGPTALPTLAPTMRIIPIPKDKYGNVDEQALTKSGFLDKFEKDIKVVASEEKLLNHTHSNLKHKESHKVKHKKVPRKKKKKSGLDFKDITKIPQAPTSIYSDDDDAGDDDADDDDQSTTPARQALRAKKQILKQFKRGQISGRAAMNENLNR